ncbi:MAG: hypothetical protein M3Q64_01075 [bacterium]|nr:hypothetical protein [bacterium]
MSLIRIMVQPGIQGKYIVPVEKALDKMLRVCNVAVEISYTNLGYWKDVCYQEGAQLLPHQSVNWLLQQAHLESLAHGTINAGTIIRESQVIAIKRGRFIPLVVTDQELVHPKHGWGIGFTAMLCASVISIGRFTNFSDGKACDLIQTLTMHELGHLFGAIRATRERDVVEAGGLHCTQSDCIMKQGVSVPDDWIALTNLRKEYHYEFCRLCFAGLQETVGKFGAASQ